MLLRLSSRRQTLLWLLEKALFICLAVVLAFLLAGLHEAFKFGQSSQYLKIKVAADRWKRPYLLQIRATQAFSCEPAELRLGSSIWPGSRPGCRCTTRNGTALIDILEVGHCTLELLIQHNCSNVPATPPLPYSAFNGLTICGTPSRYSAANLTGQCRDCFGSCLAVEAECPDYEQFGRQVGALNSLNSGVLINVTLSTHFQHPLLNAPPQGQLSLAMSDRVISTITAEQLVRWPEPLKGLILKLAYFDLIQQSEGVLTGHESPKWRLDCQEKSGLTIASAIEVHDLLAVFVMAGILALLTLFQGMILALRSKCKDGFAVFGTILPCSLSALVLVKGSRQLFALQEMHRKGCNPDSFTSSILKLVTAQHQTAIAVLVVQTTVVTSLVLIVLLRRRDEPVAQDSSMTDDNLFREKDVPLEEPV